MTTLILPRKHPNDRMPIGVNWGPELSREFAGWTIMTSVWTGEGGITLDNSSVTGKITRTWLSGGADGETYKIVNEIGGVIDGQTWSLTKELSITVQLNA